jgi:quercetin dioxygenase-like cupin family protein
MIAAAAGAVLLSIAAGAASDQHHVTMAPDAIKWGAAPPSLPPGAQAAVLLGSPAKAGPFVLRLKFPAGFVVPPHRHGQDELVTVISGAMSITSGEQVDRAAVKPMPPASFIYLPAGMPHYAVAEVESVVQINGMGPFDVTYINPKDDPRLKTMN